MASAPLANELETWLIRVVDDFEHLTPLQSRVLDAWSVLALAAEHGVDAARGDIAAANLVANELGSKTAGAARTRDALAAPVVVDARRRENPTLPAVPATGWSSPRMPPVGGWTTQLAVDAPPKGSSGGLVR